MSKECRIAACGKDVERYRDLCDSCYVSVLRLRDNPKALLWAARAGARAQAAAAGMPNGSK